MVAVAGSALAACNNASDEHEKAVEAQAEANEKIADAVNEASEKAGEAQAKADEKIAEAREGFDKLREDYRHDTNEKLAELDRKVAELEAKVKTETGKAKADLEAELQAIYPARDAFVNQYKNLEVASAQTWDKTRAEIDKAWAELKKRVDAAD
jgi:polyhydroxyalkanoate synthesis regulator phasin